MQSNNRWISVIGVSILAIMVVVGMIWGRSNSPSSEPEGDAGAATSPSAIGDGSAGDATPLSSTLRDDASARRGAAGEEETPSIGAVPDDPAECRRYCADLEERGVLANGMDSAACVRQLCQPEEEASSAAPPPEPPLTDPEIPEMPDDCRAQCELLHRRGELREGTSVEDCVSALCSTEEESGEE